MFMTVSMYTTRIDLIQYIIPGYMEKFVIYINVNVLKNNQEFDV